MTAMTRRLQRFLCIVVALCSFTFGYIIPTNGLKRQKWRLYDHDYEESSAPSTRKNRRVRPKRLFTTVQQTQARREEAQKRHAQALQDPTLLTNVQFSERTDLDPSTKRALTEVMGLQKMTSIQAQTYAAALEGKNVLGRARTGTGKTLAFLLPALERLLQGDVRLHHVGRNIGVLILAPTRELAIQIAHEAELLLTYHSNDLTAQCMYGGTKMRRDISQLNKGIPSILVATPGRLLDHIADTRLRGRRFSDIISDTKIVVLDEMDRLLSMGFQKDLRKILSYLPRAEKRQTLMFSATVPKRLRTVVQEMLKNDYVQVDCVTDNALTNVNVKQSYLLLKSMDDYVTTLLQVVLRAMESDDNYKILVFFPATKLVRFFADLLDSLDISVLQLHSRMTQSARQRASAHFRKSTQTILFTSDVSARGVDYPDVTHVIQYGSADSKITYTHRLGRTGRAGRGGEGLLVLLPFEAKLVDTFGRNQVVADTSLTNDTRVDEMMLSIRNRIQSGDVRLKSSAEGAYRAFLAYYIARMDDRQEIVQSANQFAQSVGLVQRPQLSEKSAKKMNLIGVDGVSIIETDPI